MDAVPADLADEIWRVRCMFAHRGLEAERELADERVPYFSPRNQIVLLRSLSRCARGTDFAKRCLRLANDLLSLEQGTADLRSDVNHLPARMMLLGMAVENVVHVWRLVDQIENLHARQLALGGDHHRLQRVLKFARIPLWVLAAISGKSNEDLREMTPHGLVALASHAGVGSSGEEHMLSQAEAALRLLRALPVLDVEPGAWNELLDGLSARLEAAAEASQVGEVVVPPRPCHPPGELLMAEPRIPRAPGRAVPRRSIDKGRRRLQHCGGRGGRLTL